MKVSSDYFQPHVCAGVTGESPLYLARQRVSLAFKKKKKKGSEVDGEHVFERDARSSAGAAPPAPQLKGSRWFSSRQPPLRHRRGGVLRV